MHGGQDGGTLEYRRRQPPGHRPVGIGREDPVERIGLVGLVVGAEVVEVI